MNNKLLAKLIGAAVGGSLGYFVGAVIVEIIHLKEFNPDDFEYEDLDEDPGNDDETKLEPKEPVVFMGHKPKEKRIGRVKNYAEYFDKQGKPELAALVAKYNTGVPEEDGVKEDDPNFEDEFENDPDMPTDPSIISVDDYANSEGYTVTTLKFYDDDVVTDEHDNPIDRPEQLIGEDALISFGEMSGDPDIVYVRNEAKRAVYEILRTNKHFVMHVERPRRVRPTRKENENAKEDNT